MGANFANVFLQPADAAGGGAGNFRLRAEPFARRDFRLPLRGRNCRLPQNIAAFSIAIPSRNEYSAVGKLRKRRVKRPVSSRVMDSRSFTARIECARSGKFGNTGIAEKYRVRKRLRTRRIDIGKNFRAESVAARPISKYPVSRRAAEALRPDTPRISRRLAGEKNFAITANPF